MPSDRDRPVGLLNPSRRRFLTTLAASAAATTIGCTRRRNKGEIVTYNKTPEEVLAGRPNLYASTCSGCHQHCGTLITTREGRPIKIDGNPDHPINCGKICARGQASILDLYDPERLKGPLQHKHKDKTTPITWPEADAAVIAALQNATKSKKEIAILTRRIYSPTTKRLFEEFQKTYPTTRLYAVELFDDREKRSAWETCYETPQLPVIQWNRASVILALECDFLATDGNTIEQARLFAERRDIRRLADFSRLYVVEAAMTVTGMNADHRMPLRPDTQLTFARGLLREIVVEQKESRFAKNPDIIRSLGQATLGLRENEQAFIRQVARDLIDHKGEAIVVAGSSLPKAIHVAVNFLNAALGNDRLYPPDKQSERPFPLEQPKEFEDLIRRMQVGTVGAVIHFDTNPLFFFPTGCGYEEALKKIPIAVSLSAYENETTVASDLCLPIHHDLESWGDSKTRTGVVSLQQPVISPLYETRQKETLLLAWLKAQPNAYKESLYRDFLMAAWKTTIYSQLKPNVPFETFWHAALHDGVIQIPETPARRAAFNLQAFLSMPLPLASDAKLSLLLQPHPVLYDGRLAHNGWLQELPHPVTKVVWDNVASVSKKTADSLGLKTSDVVSIKTNSGSVTIPVWIQPGMANDVVAIEYGYGRRVAGPVGTGVGTNPAALTAAATPTSVEKTGARHPLAATQENDSILDILTNNDHKKRGIIREQTVTQYRKDPAFLYQSAAWPTEAIHRAGVKWAMVIDLNRCTGCGTCAAACNVENNIPIVGKEQVFRNRQMHWLRIDRYYGGSSENPDVSVQPMLCQHCDNAPCEAVCPVLATAHSPDGLNEMAYERCVGSRHCANNCPYKVRRYNFFDFRDRFAYGHYRKSPFELVHNPEVTVRSRGVMEKCTFCIQRLREAGARAIAEGRVLKGSDAITACQQACPSDAILFGDMNDPDSEISKYRNHPLAYHVLEELHVKPNVTYIAKLRNPKTEGEQ